MDGLSLSAEYLVASDLTKLGYPVSMAAEGLSYDLVVDVGASLLKVQVKSTQGPKKQRAHRYVFRVGSARSRYHRDSFDLIAFVASDTGLIGYMAAGEVLGYEQVVLRGPDQKASKALGIHELPFSEALDKALLTKCFSLDEELGKAFGAKK